MTGTAGRLAGAAALLAVTVSLRLPGWVVVGLLALALAGVVAQSCPRPNLVGLVLSVPGAVAIATHGSIQAAGWTRLLVGVGIAAGGTLMADFDHRWRQSCTAPVLLAVTTAGVYLTVPDTEHALALLGVTVLVALLAWPWRLCSLGRAGAYVATAVVLWTVAVDGDGREASIVGGAACLGLLAIEPIARALARRRSPLAWLEAPGPRPMRVLVVVAAHLVLVSWASRVAGLRQTATQASTLVVVGFSVGLVVMIALAVISGRAAGGVDQASVAPAQGQP